MLLLGSDFDAGVRLIGPAKARALIRSLQSLLPSEPGGSTAGNADKAARRAGEERSSDVLNMIETWIEGKEDGLDWVRELKCAASSARAEGVPQQHCTALPQCCRSRPSLAARSAVCAVQRPIVTKSRTIAGGRS